LQPKSYHANLQDTVTTFKQPLTVDEAAKALGLSRHTVRAWIASRKLAHLRLGRVIRIPAGEVERVLAAALVPAARDKHQASL
jgi:excisionase family DNA binding protein